MSDLIAGLHEVKNQIPESAQADIEKLTAMYLAAKDERDDAETELSKVYDVLRYVRIRLREAEDVITRYIADE